ncbi:hypothetical protein AGMMS49546_35150 [Spirochaetia bacterium]|nr:hypothetical protein AGMMS49546_35150 [Spirochaetia bacterium]
MTQSETLDALLQGLGITTAALSRETGITPALISRYRSGGRKLPSNDKHLEAICSAIARLSPAQVSGSELPEEVLKFLEIEDIEKGENLENGLFHMLKTPALPKRRKQKTKAFSEKLDVLMETLGISNSGLARAVNIDSSAISRYRSGTRLPVASSGFIEKVSWYFCDLGMKKTHQRIVMMELVGYNTGAETITREELYNNLHSWLAETETADGAKGMAGFLDGVNNFQFSGFTPIPLEQIAPLAGEEQGKESYWGIEGLQKAVIRFLYHVAIQKEKQTLYLHSDQSMTWMIIDPKFTAIWASLMVHCLVRGHTITIIHAINRDDKELMAAIARWVPLYLIGGIKPYYFRSLEQSRYRNTMFIARSLSCITSSCLAGMEDKTEYLYDTDPRRLSVIEEQYQRLLAASNSLSTIFTASTFKNFEPYLSAFWLQENDITTLYPSLSLGTMNEALLQSMLKRVKVPDEEKQKILDYYNKNEKWTLRQIAGGHLDELVCIANKTDIAAGKVFADIPLWLLSKPLAYTTEEYHAHLDYISHIEKHNSNFRLWRLSANPFHNIKILHKKNTQTLIIKTDEPWAAFSFENPHMCGGFDNFLTALKAKESGADLYP